MRPGRHKFLAGSCRRRPSLPTRKLSTMAQLRHLSPPALHKFRYAFARAAVRRSSHALIP
jgi:hypothetical protein